VPFRINNVSGATTFESTITATSIIRTGGTSAQFLKADGSVDSNTYYLASNPSAFIALTALSGTAPIQYNNTTGAISITQASGSTNGFLSSTDWNTFNNKTSNVGTVTSVAALTLGTTGTDLSSSVANGTTTPVITLNVPTASAANRGALSAADWTTFNNKQNALTNPVTGTGTAGQVAYWSSTSAITGESNLFWDATNDRLGVGTASPATLLHISSATAGASILRIENTSGTFETTSDFLELQFKAKRGVTTTDRAKISVGRGAIGGSDSDAFMSFYTHTGGALTEKMRITSGGNVGIGRTPDWKLDVNGIINAEGTGNAIGITNGFYIARFVPTSGNGGLTIGYNTADVIGYISSSGTNSSLGFLTNSGGTTVERMRIFSDGNVFIGSSPSNAGFKLDVNGTGRFSGALQVASNITAINGAMEFSGSGSAPSTDPAIYRVGGVNSLAFAIGSIPRLTIASTGAATFSSSVTAGGTITLNAPSANYATLNLNGAAGYGAELKFGEATGGYLAAIRHNYNVGTGLEFYTGGLSGGNLRMYIAPSGNVGVGTNTPSSLFTVAGASDLAWSAATSKLQILRSGSQARINNYESGSGSSIALNWDGGNVLIGTTTDGGFKLDVNGTGRFSASSANVLDLTNTAANTYGVLALRGNSRSGEIDFFTNSTINAAIWSTSNNLTFATNGYTPALTLASTGAATFSSSVTATAGIFNLNTTDGGFKIVGVNATPPNLAYLANNYFPKFYTRNHNFGITIFDQDSNNVGIQAADLVNGTSAKALIFNPYGGNVLIGTDSDNSNKLRVNGNIWADGNILMDSSVNRFVGFGTGNSNAHISFLSTNTLSLNSSSGGLIQFNINGNQIGRFNSVEVFANSVLTSAPYGTTARSWKLGRYITETTFADGSIRVEIDGRYYNIAAQDLGVVPS
jgi:hypothetical protein